MDMGRERNNGLGESFTFSLEQAVTRLGTLEFSLHNTQGLPCGEDGLAILSPPLIVSQRHGPGCGNCGEQLGWARTAAPDMFAIRQWPRYTRGRV